MSCTKFYKFLNISSSLDDFKVGKFNFGHPVLYIYMVYFIPLCFTTITFHVSCLTEQNNVYHIHSDDTHRKYHKILTLGIIDDKKIKKRFTL